MKRIVFILLCFLSLCSSSCNNSRREQKAEAAKAGLTTEEKKPLVALGQLWGFLKYHHPEVAGGKYDWDLELIKMVPVILDAPKESEWKAILDEWVGRMPPVLQNKGKEMPVSDIKVRPDYGILFDPDYFNPETIGKIRYILDNAEISSNHYIEIHPGSYPQLTNEPAYDQMLYPDLNYRLLALYRYWNIVNYFFPHRELCGQKWADVLGEMLPDFVYAGNEEEYMLACLKLAAKIDDSHAFFISGDRNQIRAEWEGVFKVPFETGFVEKQLVVTSYTKENEGISNKIKIGDVITKIDGVEVEKTAEKLLPYTPASNGAVKLREISHKILRGNTTKIVLSILRDGQVLDIEMPRYYIGRLKIPDYFNTQPEKKSYRRIDDSIGYVFAANYKNEELNDIKKSFSGTKGMIVDLRCYPVDFMETTFGSYLNPDQTAYSRISSGSVSYPGYFFFSPSRQPVRRNEGCYPGKVVVIVNEYTQSKAENTVLAFQTAPHVVIIGSMTAGANGGVSYFDLPGGIRTSMTGLGVYYPDGSELQRKGVKINEIVEPTIGGIKDGRDELLERAIEIIKENQQ